jgi:hypothetical protein
MVNSDKDSVRDALKAFIDRAAREKPGKVVDIDVEVARLAQLLPPNVGFSEGDLREELARLATDRLMPIKMG